MSLDYGDERQSLEWIDSGASKKYADVFDHDDRHDFDNNDGNPIVSQIDDAVAAVTKRDIILYFVCGAMADALPGFFFSATVIGYLNIPCGNASQLSLSADVGGLIGVLVATFWLPNAIRSPLGRVWCNTVFQCIGILLAWWIEGPYNVIFGIGILTVGFQGMMATLLSLTSYAGPMATRSYQVGFSAAPILGALIVQLHDLLGAGVNVLFGVALGIPVVNALSVMGIDRSTWDHQKPLKESTDIGAASESGCRRIENEDCRQSIGPSEVLSTKHSSTATTTTTAKDTKSSTSEHKRTLKIRDYRLASHEVAFRYWILYFVCFFTNKIWTGSIQTPPLYSSSATYSGADEEDAKAMADTVILVAHLVVFGIGMSIFTPLGRLWPRTQQPAWLWIPTFLQLTVVVIILVGLVVPGAFAPMSVPGAYLAGITVMGSYFTVFLYGPLFVRHDKLTTKSYKAFQLQSLFVVINVAYLSADIFNVFYASGTIRQACIANYEDGAEYRNETISCTYFAEGCGNDK